MTLESILKKASLLAVLLVSALSLLSIFGLFTTQNVQTLLLIAGIFIILFFFKNGIIDKKKIHFKTNDLTALLLILIMCSIAYFFHHDFSQGRDEMVHLVSANQLSINGNLTIQDALGHTFSGFYEIRENTFTFQFLPAYISTLGAFILFGNFEAAYLANPIILFFAFAAIYFTAKNIKNERVGLIALSIFGTMYTTLWFTKRLNSEILFIALFWIAIWFFFSAIKEQRYNWAILAYIPLSSLLLTRGEATLFFITFTLFSSLYLIKYAPKKSNTRIFKKRYIAFFMPIILNIVGFIYYVLAYNDSYFIDQIGNFESAFTSFTPTSIFAALIVFGLSALAYLYIKMRTSIDIDGNKQRITLIFFFIGIASLVAFYVYSIATETLSWSFYRIIFSLEIFSLYLISFLALFICKTLFENNLSRKIFYLFLIVSPAFIFLIEHNIAPDQPWFMRRFFAVLIPFIVIAASYSLYKTHMIPEKKLLLFVGIISINVILALPTTLFVDNKGMSRQIKSFSQHFQKNDLLIMEPGWDWQKWAYPMRYLHGINVIPNLNIDNINTKSEEELFLLTQKYPKWQTNTEDLLAIKNAHEEKQLALLKPFVDSAERVFVLSPSSIDFPHYDERNMNLVERVIFSYETLTPSTDLLGYIKENGSNMDIRVIHEAQKNTPPRNIRTKKIDLLLLEVVDPAKITQTSKMSDEQIVLYREYLEELVQKRK